MDRPLRHIDHVMWDMEMPTSLVTVAGMMTFRDAPEAAEVVRIAEERLLRYGRFRQKVVMKNGRPAWRDDDMFDIRAHFHHVALPGSGGYKELQQLVSDLMATPLDYSKPLWQVHIIDGYEGGSAILWRIHHAIADGIALIKVVFSLTGTEAEDSLRPVEDRTEKEHHEKRALLDRWKARLDHALHLGEDLYHDAVHLVREPRLLGDALKESWETTRELARLITDPHRRDSIYKGRLGVRKKAAWSAPVPLSVVKQIGRRLDATVNDVMLAVMSGAIRRHLLHHGEDVHVPFRVVCPVNWRADKYIKVENSIGMISLELPLAIDDPKERILSIRERTRQLKHSMEPAAVYSILHIAGDLLPRRLEVAAAEYIGDRIMGVLSNVPGPRQIIYFAGKPVDQIMFWIPQTNALGVGISIISYNEKVSLGVATDEQVIDDPDFIMDAFHEEFDRMHREILGEKSDVS